MRPKKYIHSQKRLPQRHMSSRPRRRKSLEHRDVTAYNAATVARDKGNKNENELDHLCRQRKYASTSILPTLHDNYSSSDATNVPAAAATAAATTTTAAYTDFAEKIEFTLPPMSIAEDDTIDDVLSRSFFAVSLWIGMYLRACHTRDNSCARWFTNVHLIDVATVQRMLTNSVVMGVYMWNMVCMRLQCRKFRLETWRAMANSSSADALFEGLPSALARQREHMVSAECAGNAPEVNLVNIVREFRMERVVTEEYTVPMHADDQRADIHKRGALVSVLDPASSCKTSAPRYDIEVLVNSGKLNEFVERLDGKCYIKFTWFMYQVLPIDFGLAILCWYRDVDGSDPHADFIRAEPLFAYLYRCIKNEDFDYSDCGGDEHNSAEKLSIRAEKLSQRKKKSDMAGHEAKNNQGELIEFLSTMLKSVICTRNVRQCRACRYTLIDVMQGSGSTTPEQKNRLRTCPVATCAISIKRRVNNMTKRIKKKNNEHELAISVSPVLKHMLSLILFKVKERERETLAGRDSVGFPRYNGTNEDGALKLIYKHKIGAQKTRHSEPVPTRVEDMKNYTVYPLTIRELLCIQDLYSFNATVNTASGAATHISVHVLDPFASRERSRFLVYIPMCAPDRSERAVAYVVVGVDNMARFWQHSPFHDGGRIVHVKSFRLSTSGVSRFRVQFIRDANEFVCR